MTQLYRIADLLVQMDSFGRTVEQAKPYLSEGTGEPDIVIHSRWQSLQKMAPHLSDESCEYLSTGSSFYRQLLEYDGMLLHASAVVMDGRAYLFSAPCGTGKSTHTKLWLQVFGERAQILNDDKPALRLVDGVFYAYGTPWSGKYDVSLNVRVPVGGICILRRGEENRIEPYSGTMAIYDILAQTARSKDPAMMEKLLTLMGILLEKVPVWKMECNMDPSAAQVSYAAMSGKDRI